MAHGPEVPDAAWFEAEACSPDDLDDESSPSMTTEQVQWIEASALSPDDHEAGDT